MTWPALVACGSVVAGMLVARSVRGGFSGPLGSYLALAGQAALVASLVLLGILIGWWTIAIFIGASVIAGVVIVRDTLTWWVLTQPAWGGLAVILAAAAWAGAYL